MTFRLVLTLALSVLALPGCSRIAESATTPNSAGEQRISDGTISANPHDVTLKEIAANYQDWGRVDNQMRWAPTMCMMPRASVGRFSEKGPHGDKIYWLFAKHRSEYMAASSEHSQPVGQVIVKEAWKPELTDRTTGYEVSVELPNPDIVGGSYSPFAQRDGKVYKATERRGLYVMFKLDPETEQTDQGWVYGTLDVDGNVTAAGRLSSCMKCHEQTDNDRLFGLQPEAERLELAWERH